MSIELAAVLIAFCGLLLAVIKATVNVTRAITSSAAETGKNLSDFKREFFAKFETHEAQDDRRHEDNLEKFKDLTVAVTRLETPRRRM